MYCEYHTNTNFIVRGWYDIDFSPMSKQVCSNSNGDVEPVDHVTACFARLNSRKHSLTFCFSEASGGHAVMSNISETSTKGFMFMQLQLAMLRCNQGQGMSELN